MYGWKVGGKRTTKQRQAVSNADHARHGLKKIEALFKLKRST
jgi:hypothetical protein